jgi:hypothetical protein
MTGRLFIFGLGYSALALVRLLRPQGWSLAGTVRSAAKAADLQPTLGFPVLPFDRNRPLPPGTLDDVTHLLSTVPPDAAGDPVLAGADIPQSHHLTWAGYLSTTGVYGDTGGAWVTEDSALNPAGPRGRARVAAEADWRDRARSGGFPLHIFRLPGIYGPGRSALDSLRAGTARRLDKPGQIFGRVHVDDIATALAASMLRPHPDAIYNIADDEPAATPDVVAFAAGLLGLPVPPLEPFDPATLSPMAASFYGECKRVSNVRAKQDLDWTPRYPSYREGLRAQAEAESISVLPTG